MRLLDVAPLVVATDDDRLTGATLDRGARAMPTDVFAVVATAGTTNAGIIDDLAGIADVCAARGLWMHVDAAYGGAALLAPSVRDRFRGIDRADSLDHRPAQVAVRAVRLRGAPLPRTEHSHARCTRRTRRIST